MDGPWITNPPIASYYRDSSPQDLYAMTLQGGRLNRVVGWAGSRARQTRAVCLSNMKAC